MQSADLTLVRGNDQDLNIMVTNADGSIYDLTSCTLAFNVTRQTYYGTSISPYPINATILDAAAGTAKFSFTPGDTQNMDNQSYFFTITLTTAASKIVTLAAGTLSIVPFNQ